MAAEGPPGPGQVVADEAEAAVGGQEPQLGEGPLALDLGELRGRVVELGLQLLLPVLGGRQVVGDAGDGHAEDERDHDQAGRDDAGS